MPAAAPSYRAKPPRASARLAMPHRPPPQPPHIARCPTTRTGKTARRSSRARLRRLSWLAALRRASPMSAAAAKADVQRRRGKRAEFSCSNRIPLEPRAMGEYTARRGYSKTHSHTCACACARAAGISVLSTNVGTSNSSRTLVVLTARPSTRGWCCRRSSAWGSPSALWAPHPHPQAQAHPCS